MVVKVKLVDVIGYNGLVMTSDDKRFVDTYGEFIKVGSPKNLYSNMHDISNWCENTFDEKCEFVVCANKTAQFC